MQEIPSGIRRIHVLPSIIIKGNVAIYYNKNQGSWTYAIGPAHVRTRRGGWVPPPRLPLFFAVPASVPVSAPEPAYPAPRPPLLRHSGWWEWLNSYQEGIIIGYGNGSRRVRAQAPTGETDRGEERRARPLHGLGSTGAGKTDHGEREADKAQGRPQGSGASADRQEQPWRLWRGGQGEG